MYVRSAFIAARDAPRLGNVPASQATIYSRLSYLFGTADTYSPFPHFSPTQCSGPTFPLQTVEYALDPEERDAKRAAYAPAREREQHARRRLALRGRGKSPPQPAGSAGVDHGGSGGGGSGVGGLAVSGAASGGGGGCGDAELEAANRGLPPGWKAERSSSRAGLIYWHREGLHGSSQWTRPAADDPPRRGGGGGGGGWDRAAGRRP